MRDDLPFDRERLFNQAEPVRAGFQLQSEGQRVQKQSDESFAINVFRPAVADQATH